MRGFCFLMLGACLAFMPSAKAMDFTFDGYADARVIIPVMERSWVDGGEGKLRFGGNQPSPNLRLVEAIGQASLALTSDLTLISVLRIEPEQRSGVDALETYLAWRPQADGDWQYAAKAGAFFPTISLENDDLGWASPYTLTPSAINSWIGEELRTIGGEGTLTRHTDWGTISAVGALMCCNEVAGVLIADRGWALDDRPTGLFERIRIPDATVKLFGGHGPGRTGEFDDIDGHVGWYAGLNWDVPGWARVSLLRYDNNADPFAFTANDSSWLTRFWSGAIKTNVAGVTVLAQGLSGDTAIGFSGKLSVTNFQSAFLLASYDIGDWRLSARTEAFQTRHPGFRAMDEDGDAFTLALIWSTTDWLRLSAEALALDSHRTERLVQGLAPGQNGLQFQVGARAFF